jgi:hypothetical protein
MSCHPNEYTTEEQLSNERDELAVIKQIGFDGGQV